jgi:Secretion system C-terminal sorting domain/Leucine Rich repeats (2 copies)
MKTCVLILSVLLLNIFNAQSKEIFYQLSQEEVDEVNKLYYECGGENWTFSNGWPVTTEKFTTIGEWNRIVEFRGLSANSNDIIISENENEVIYEANLTLISFDNNNLSGKLPLMNLPLLGGLNLPNNNLSGQIPNFNLPNLTLLGLYGNQLSGQIPDFDLPNLEVLLLYSNKLSGDIPDFALPKLTQLALSYNQLTGTIPDFDLPKLYFLILEFNRLSGAIPDLNLPGLNQLIVRGNKYTMGPLETNINKYVTYSFVYQDTILPITQTNNILEVIVDGTANTYQWFLDENKINGATRKNYKLGENGIYKCVVKGNILHLLTLESEEFEFNTSSIFQVDEKSDIQITQRGDELNINYHENGIISSIEIYDANGLLVHSANNLQSIDISSFSSGVYFIKLNVGAEIITEKFVISK